MTQDKKPALTAAERQRICRARKRERGQPLTARFDAALREHVFSLYQAGEQSIDQSGSCRTSCRGGENIVEVVDALRRSVGGAAEETKAPKKTVRRGGRRPPQEMSMPITGQKPPK